MGPILGILSTSVLPAPLIYNREAWVPGAAHAGSLLVGLVREFLEWTGLEFTLKVYDPEMCIGGSAQAAAAAAAPPPAVPSRSRQDLAKELVRALHGAAGGVRWRRSLGAWGRRARPATQK